MQSWVDIRFLGAAVGNLTQNNFAVLVFVFNLCCQIVLNPCYPNRQGSTFLSCGKCWGYSGSSLETHHGNGHSSWCIFYWCGWNGITCQIVHIFTKTPLRQTLAPRTKTTVWYFSEIQSVLWLLKNQITNIWTHFRCRSRMKLRFFEERPTFADLFFEAWALVRLMICLQLWQSLQDENEGSPLNLLQRRQRQRVQDSSVLFRLKILGALHGHEWRCVETSWNITARNSAKPSYRCDLSGDFFPKMSVVFMEQWPLCGLIFVFEPHNLRISWVFLGFFLGILLK